MKAFLLLFTFSAVSLFSSGQNVHFKQIQKNKSGIIHPQFKYKTVNGYRTQQNALSTQAYTPVQLTFPVLAATDKPTVIKKNNSPVFISRKMPGLHSLSTSDHTGIFFRFMEDVKSITGISNPKEAFKVKKVYTDEQGITRIRTVQQFKGIEIYGSESTFHIGKERERFTGSVCHIDENISAEPKIDITSALDIVTEDCRRITVFTDLTPEEKKMLHYDNPGRNLILYKLNDQDYVLAWEVSIRPNFLEEWKYFIDATNGKIVRRYNNTNYADGPATGNAPDLNNVIRSVDVYLEQGMYYLYNISETMYNPATEEGIILTLDANNTSTSALKYTMVSCDDNAWTNQQAAISAHYNANIVYDYFKSKFGRNSINGQGGNIISFINVSEDDGSSMQNAFWNGHAVFYGNGGSAFKSLAGALDVAAHELGHGVVSNTANLEYYGQSGAINETYADIFGSMVDRSDWLIGEDVVKAAYFPSGALRNMADPHNGGNQDDHYWQPAHFSEAYLGNEDNAGVHINSGIGNYAFYLFSVATSKDKAELVFYKALNEYLTKTSQFIDFRIAVIESAKDIYGDASTEASEAVKAFDQVGIHEDVPVETPDDYEVNPGQENLLIYNTDTGIPYTLFTSPVPAVTYSPLSASEMKSRVSVTDDGSIGAFVGADNIIYSVSLDSENPFENELSDPFFDNVAVSKDGNRIAAISTQIDTAVYVYDYINEEWCKFRLYNPTTGDGSMISGGVLYADAIEFDHSGEYLIYDAYNELNSDVSEDISYWDVGFIKVWDNQSGSFGDGTIFKLFTSLPENVSIGNPVFSKNSPGIIAFDYFYDDGMDEEYAVYGANLETGDLDVITVNTTLGYPSFSKNDDRIAFTYLQDLGFSNREDIYSIGLDASKISPVGSAQLEVDYAKWPVYYAEGTRNLELKPVANFTADYKTGSAPLVVQFIDLSANEPTSWSWTFQGGIPSVSAEQNPRVTYNTVGTYKVSLTAVNNIGNSTISREGYIVVSDVTGTDKPEVETILFYPNPVKNVLTITSKSNFTVKIYNQEGRILKSASNANQVDVSGLNSGLYILEITTGNGTTRHKLLKE